MFVNLVFECFKMTLALCIFTEKNRAGNGQNPTLNRHRTHIWFFIMDISIKSLLPHSKISCTGFTHFPHNSANFSHERSFAFFKSSVCVRILKHWGLNCLNLEGNKQFHELFKTQYEDSFVRSWYKISIFNFIIVCQNLKCLYLWI